MNYYLILALVLFIYMSLWFVVSVLKKRNDVADIAWGLGFVLVSWVSFLVAENFSLRAYLVNFVVSIWGFRLAWHIYGRNKGKKEDYRYLAWREQWGTWFYFRSYLQVFLLQGLLLFLITLPVLFINKYAGPTLNFLDLLGLLVWLIGFLLEATGDWQLANFLKNPLNKGKLMQSGLWRYSRHPNYFGEVLQWWGIWLVAINVPLAALSLLGPITITLLILKVSGIPLLEEKMASHPDFAAYKNRTSIFVPLPPRNEKNI